jgi:hypothetical protein
MIKPETYCVITIGKRFLRFRESPIIVCQNIEHAAPLYTLEEVRSVWQKLKAAGLKKPLKCWKVEIKEFDADG